MSGPERLCSNCDHHTLGGQGVYCTLFYEVVHDEKRVAEECGEFANPEEMSGSSTGEIASNGTILPMVPRALKELRVPLEGYGRPVLFAHPACREAERSLRVQVEIHYYGKEEHADKLEADLTHELESLYGSQAKVSRVE